VGIRPTAKTDGAASALTAGCAATNRRAM